MSTADINVAISNVSHSQIVVGHRNVALQLTLEGNAGYSDRYVSPPLLPRELPVMRVRPAADPLGRESVIDQAAGALLQGRSVQLCGAPGVGKTAVAEAIARRLGTAERRGVMLGGGRPRAQVGPLFTELAKILFSVDWYEPDEATLAAETARYRPSGVIVVPDCALSAEDTDRLLRAFPDCLFVLCSTQQSLYTDDLVVDLEPLSLDDARALVERRLGRPLDGFENLQLRHIHELGEGRVSRLLVCAAFLQRATADARPRDAVPLSAQEQIAVLLTGTSEPARRALAALCSFGPTPEALFDALTGLESTAGAGDELEHAGLATRVGELLVATDDAIEAMRGRGWYADPLAAAACLSPLLSQREPAAAPSPALCAAVAQALLDANLVDAASAFTRVAAPAALAAGDLAAWQRLVTIGLRATSSGGRPENLAYFLTEEHTRNLLRGDRVAAAAALAALAAELAHHASPAVAPTPSSTPAQPASPSAKPARSSLRRDIQKRFGRGVAGAVMIGAPIAAIAAAAGAALGAASLTRPAAQSSTTGSDNAVSGGRATTGPGFGAARAFPYSLAAQSQAKDAGGSNPYRFDGTYPVVSGLANAAVEQKINAALRAPVGTAADSTPTGGAAPEPGETTLDPYTSSTESVVYQSGSLITAMYTTIFHFSGAADVSYGLTTVTVRTDTGDVVPAADILTPAATTTDVDTLITDLQGTPGISGCDTSSGWNGESSLAAALRDAGPGKLPFVLSVTPTGLLFSFADDTISGTACRPAGLLTWSRLAGLVNPQVEQLANTVPGGAVPKIVLEPSGGPSGAAPSAASTPAGVSASPSATGPAGVVLAYYAAINAKNYRQAWALGGHNLNSDYQTFANGYASTRSAVVTVISVNGDTVTVSLTATHTDGSGLKYQGTYTVSGGQIATAHLNPVG